MREHGLKQEEGARQLHLNLALPYLKGYCAKGMGRHWKEPIVDYHVDVPQFSHTLVHDGFDLRRIAEVTQPGYNSHPQGGHSAGGVVELRLVAQGRQKEIGSFSGKGQRYGGAEVSQGIGDKNGFAFQLGLHAYPFAYRKYAPPLTR